MTLPETKYTRSGAIRIAYQVVGKGPLDLVMVPGFVSNVEVQWEDPGFHHLLARVSGFCRLITFDKRGTGLSDHVDPHNLPDLETRMDDVRAVMDAAGSKEAAIFGGCEGGSMAMLFAATYPARTRGLVLYGAYARFDPSAVPPLSTYIERVEKHWGSSQAVADYAPSAVNDRRFCEWFGRFQRLGASPAAAIEFFKMNASIDVREILPTIRVPTLVLHRREDVRVKVAAGRYLASRIPSAKYVELDGLDHLPWVGDVDGVVDEIQEFLTGVRPAPEADHVLATILVVRVPGAATQAAGIGHDGATASSMPLHDIVGDAIIRYSGQVLDSNDNEITARFDGPVRALRCGLSIVETAKARGVDLAAAVHAGQIAIHDGRVSGPVIQVAGQIASLADPGEVLASRVVADLLPGSGVVFSDRAVAAVDGAAQGLAVLVARAGSDKPLPAAEACTVDALSAREKEVLALVANGLSNAAIGEHLSLSPFTVKRHVGNILMKLDLPNRAAAAGVAARHSNYA